MDVHTAAYFLAAIRIVSAIFIGMVLVTQIPLLRAPHDALGRITQYILLAIALVIFLGNLIPVAVDLATVLGDIERSSQVLNTIGIGYAFSNAVTSVLSAVLIWLMYKVIAISNAKSR